MPYVSCMKRQKCRKENFSFKHFVFFWCGLILSWIHFVISVLVPSVW